MDHLQTISPVQTERNIFGQQLPTLLVIDWELLVQAPGERSTLSFPGPFFRDDDNNPCRRPTIKFPTR